MDYYHYFAYTGNIVELVPVIIGIIFYKKEERKYRFFLFYLILGLLVDSVKPFLMSANADETIRSINHFYSIIEITFLVWFIAQCIDNKKIKDAVFGVILLTVIFCLYCHFIYEVSYMNYSALFDVSTFILIAAASAYALLNMTQEKTNITSHPDFWFMTSIFMYFFIAGFLFSFLESDFLKKIWFINNTISVVAYLVIGKAYWVIGRKNQ